MANLIDMVHKKEVREYVQQPSRDELLAVTSTARFQKAGQVLRWTRQPGFIGRIHVDAVIDMAPEEVYAVLTHEDNHNIIRSTEKVLCRSVVRESDTEKHVYTELASVIGKLMFKKRFVTAFNIVEQPQQRIIQFSLARPGTMAALQGHWIISELPQSKSKGVDRRRTLLHLQQDMLPAGARGAPKMVHGLIRKMCRGAATDIIEDLRLVASLRQHGISLETILQSRIHGRGGLKHEVLRNHSVRDEAQEQQKQTHSDSTCVNSIQSYNFAAEDEMFGAQGLEFTSASDDEDDDFTAELRE